MTDDGLIKFIYFCLQLALTLGMVTFKPQHRTSKRDVITNLSYSGFSGSGSSSGKATSQITPYTPFAFLSSSLGERLWICSYSTGISKSPAISYTSCPLICGSLCAGVWTSAYSTGIAMCLPSWICVFSN